MSDEIISKSSNISFVDEDAPNADSGASRPIASWITSKRLTNAEAGDACLRNVRSFTTFSASGPSAIARRDLSASDDGKMLNHRRESLQQRHARQSSVSRRDQNEEIESASQRYENVVLRYQKPRPQSKRQISREHQQQQNNNSSSDESVARNKSKSTSSIDAQSVNNILDEYEDLDYCRSSDLSDVGNINVTNFEAIIMDQQKRQQQQERSKLSGTKVQIKSIPTREKIQPVLKVNQQTQVRQRSRDRQKDSSKAHQQDNCRASSPTTMDTIESGRSKMPEMLLRRGEVQKRVDEWLNQAHNQNFPLSPREKPLTRSNSSAEQKSQRRYRVQDSRSRSIDEAKSKLNGGASSSYDDLTRMDHKMERGKPDRVNVGVNTSRGTYKEYLAMRNKVKQQDYGFGAQSNIASSKSSDSNPASRIPQREPLGSSFRSRRAEINSEEKNSADGRIANLVKTRGESNYGRTTVNSSKMTEVSTVTSTTTTSIISCRKPSLKRSGNGADQNCAVARSLVKEETDPRLPRGAGFSKGPLSTGNLGDQGELISPNKDGESRRPAAAASGPTPRLAAAAADKAVEAICKSMEAPTSCAADHPRDNSPRITSIESGMAIESRRRLQISSDVRREARSIDQSRQEQPSYGLTVGAHVRAFQGQAESRSGLRIRCHQVGTSMEIRKPPVFSRKDLAASSSRDVETQDLTKASIDVSSSSFKPNNRAYIATSDPQKSNEQNATGSKVAICEAVPCGKITRYTSPDHVERIYERSLQPQVIHADDLESILRPSLQVSPYGERISATRSDRDSPVKETSSILEDESFDRIGESRHEHLETIEEDDRKSEDSVCKYPEIGLKQCLKVQQSLPNGRSRESADKRKDNSSNYAKDQQHLVVFNEPARTFATFQTTSPCQGNVKSSVQSRSSDMKESKEEIKQNSDETTMILQDLIIGYQNTSREDQDRLMIHSRENSNLSTATIPIDELESQRSSRSKSEGESSRNKLQFSEKSQDRVEETTKNAEECGAVINEVLVKNLRFEQDLPEIPAETKVDHSVQPVNFHNILCDDYENEKLRNKKIYMTKEEIHHQRLIDMLKKGDLEALKTVSDKDI
ncbi:hypothetical protein ACS0PU_003889 [Formica fusca]